MKITIDTAEELSMSDTKILQMLLDDADLSTFKPEQSSEPVLKDEPESNPDAVPKTEEVPDDQMDLAVQRALDLVSSGKRDLVKAALTTVGAERVSHLTPETVPAFLEALDA